MIRPGRERLNGMVEVDESHVGGFRAGQWCPHRRMAGLFVGGGERLPP
jgi:hypothetical protein